jgi:hypothetical protein
MGAEMINNKKIKADRNFETNKSLISIGRVLRISICVFAKKRFWKSLRAINESMKIFTL